MTRLPSTCVLRNWSGEYLTPFGHLTTVRQSAAILTREDARRLQAAFTYDRRNRPQVTTLSIEDLPKKQRRTHPPLSPASVQGLLQQITLMELRAEATALLRRAAEHQRSAAAYQDQAAAIDQRIRHLFRPIAPGVR